jgi:hypothetical protein
LEFEVRAAIDASHAERRGAPEALGAPFMRAEPAANSIDLDPRRA